MYSSSYRICNIFFVCSHPSPGDVKFPLISVNRQACCWQTKMTLHLPWGSKQPALAQVLSSVALLGLRAEVQRCWPLLMLNRTRSSVKCKMMWEAVGGSSK